MDFFFRKRLCYSCYNTGTQSSECRQLSHSIVSRSRSSRSLFSNAIRCSLRSPERMDTRTGTMWHVDVQWRFVLYGFYSTSRSHSTRSVRTNFLIHTSNCIVLIKRFSIIYLMNYLFNKWFVSFLYARSTSFEVMKHSVTFSLLKFIQIVSNPTFIYF